MNKGTRLLIILSMVLAIPMLAYLAYQYFRPPMAVADMAPDLAEHAPVIGKHYMEDEIKADKLYLGKTIDISGRVAEVQTQDGKGATIYFASDDNGFPVSVLMSAGMSGSDSPKKGDSVLIRGVCTGFLMDVNFNRGMIIKKY